MSRNSKKTPAININRIELKCIIIRHSGNQKNFCERYNLSHTTIRTYLSGRNMPAIDLKIKDIIHDLGYNPDGSRILPEISPDLKLQIAGNNG